MLYVVIDFSRDWALPYANIPGAWMHGEFKVYDDFGLRAINPHTEAIYEAEVGGSWSRVPGRGVINTDTVRLLRRVSPAHLARIGL